MRPILEQEVDKRTTLKAKEDAEENTREDSKNDLRHEGDREDDAGLMAWDCCLIEGGSLCGYDKSTEHRKKKIRIDRCVFTFQEHTIVTP